jgi:hypothetical protein
MMHGVCGLGVRRLDEAENLPLLLVHPVLLVVDTVVVLVLDVFRVRRPTRPGKAARERRLQEKRQQASRKRLRRPPADE